MLGMKKLLVTVVLLAMSAAPAHGAFLTGTIHDGKGQSYTIDSSDYLSGPHVGTRSYGAGVVDASTGKAYQYGHVRCGYTYTDLYDLGRLVEEGKDRWIKAGSKRSAGTCYMAPLETISFSHARWLGYAVPSDFKSTVRPSESLSYARLAVDGIYVEGLLSIAISKDSASQLDYYCRVYAAPAIDRTVDVRQMPQNLRRDCAAIGILPDKDESGNGDYDTPPKPSEAKQPSSNNKEAVATPKPTKKTNRIAVPRAAKKCRAVQSAVVRTQRVSCKSARSIVSRYTRSFKSPKGWSCTAVINDKQRRIKCSQRTKQGKVMHSKSVYGLLRSVRALKAR